MKPKPNSRITLKVTEIPSSPLWKQTWATSTYITHAIGKALAIILELLLAKNALPAVNLPAKIAKKIKKIPNTHNVLEKPW